MKTAIRLFVIFAFSAVANAEVKIVLKDSFIQEFQNRATITADYTVVHAHAKPNPPAKDADLHIAGTAPEIGLAAVAEIMNAKEAKPAMDAIHAVEGKNKPIKVVGAWRLWPEHAGGTDQIQTDDIDGIIKNIKNTNPDHVFQIHPLSSVGTVDVRKGFHPITGFKPKDATQAFTQYENLRCKISHDDAEKTTTILTNMAGFNYVKFRMELTEDPNQLRSGDGTVLLANVYTVGDDEELLVRRRRMIFLKGTPPDTAVKKMKAGDKVIVLGIPRIDLALVTARLANVDKRPEMLDWNLPYEIVIVGVFPKTK